jgi:hypothetical protein
VLLYYFSSKRNVNRARARQQQQQQMKTKVESQNESETHGIARMMRVRVPLGHPPPERVCCSKEDLKKKMYLFI